MVRPTALAEITVPAVQLFGKLGRVLWAPECLSSPRNAVQRASRDGNRQGSGHCHDPREIFNPALRRSPLKLFLASNGNQALEILFEGRRGRALGLDGWHEVQSVGPVIYPPAGPEKRPSLSENTISTRRFC